MNKQHLSTLFQQYLDGNMTSEEQALFFKMIREEPMQPELDRLLSEVWQNSGARQPGQVSDASHKRINAIMVKVRGGVKKKRLSYRPWLAAASIALLIGLSVALRQMMKTPAVQYYSVAAGKGQKKKIILPDSSVVYLNSGSTLQYSNVFNKKGRDVTLSGEAYFEVSKNQDKPFTINAGTLYIRVLGTTFNVSAYGRQEAFKVAVSSGAVKVGFPEAATRKYFADQLLTAGQKLVFTKDNEMSVNRQADVNADRSWKEGLLVFDNNTLPEVAAILERWYNVGIQVNIPHAEACHFSGKFERLGLHEVLDILRLTGGFSYRDAKGSIILYGSACK